MDPGCLESRRTLKCHLEKTVIPHVPHSTLNPFWTQQEICHLDLESVGDHSLFTHNFLPGVKVSLQNPPLKKEGLKCQDRSQYRLRASGLINVNIRREHRSLVIGQSFFIVTRRLKTTNTLKRSSFCPSFYYLSGGGTEELTINVFL